MDLSPLRILVQAIGSGDWQLLEGLALELPLYLHFAKCTLSPRILPLKVGFVPSRKQFHADQILASLILPTGFDRVFGVVEVDIFVPPFNFVFGIAENNGRRALISINRLKDPPDRDNGSKLLKQRTLKESLHELGHTLGIQHCRDSSCVMFFSNSLYDTDKKGPSFCKLCIRKAEINWKKQIST